MQVDLLTPPLAWLLGMRAGLGAAGGWIGLAFEIIVGAAIFWWRVHRGGWRHAAEASRAGVLENDDAEDVSPSGNQFETANSPSMG
jgi:hypothetical protein